MSHQTATLYIRVTTVDGKRPYCKPVYLSKGRLKPLFAVVNRKPEHHPEGVYYLRLRRAANRRSFPWATTHTSPWTSSQKNSVGCEIGSVALLTRPQSPRSLRVVD